MTVTIEPVTGLGEVSPGDDLAGLLASALAPLGPAPGDIVVVTHKVVSKAEGRLVPAPDAEAHRRLVEEEAVRVLRRRGDMVIAATRHGFVCANAGVDRSNVPAGWAVLLPVDPDRSAHRLRKRLGRQLGVDLGVVVSDTFGRAWRRGQTDVAIGVSGMAAVLDLRGTTDAGGRLLTATEVALADEVAAAADLVMGKAEGIPAALLRGVTGADAKAENTAADLVRDPGEDLFL